MVKPPPSSLGTKELGIRYFIVLKSIGDNTCKIIYEKLNYKTLFRKKKKAKAKDKKY